MTIGPVSTAYLMANSKALRTAKTSIPSTQMPGNTSPLLKYSVLHDERSALVPIPSNNNHNAILHKNIHNNMTKMEMEMEMKLPY